MAANSDLQTFLKSQLEEFIPQPGGVFTIPERLVRANTVVYRGKEESIPFLLILQLAVQAAASEIAVEFLKNRASLAFVLATPSEDLSPHRLAAYWTQPKKICSPLTIDLAQALAILKSQGHRRITWTAAGGSTRNILSLGAYDTTLSSIKQPPQKRYFYKIEVSGFSERGVGPSWSATAQAALASRCAYAPLRLTLDSRPLQGRWHPKSSPFWHPKRSLGYRLAQVYFFDSNSTSPKKQILLPPIEPERYARIGTLWRQQGEYSEKTGPLLAAFWERDRFTSEFPPAPWKCQGTVVFHLSMTGPDRVSFVRNGVLLNPVILEEEGSGLEVLWDSNALSTDESYLQPVKNKQLNASLHQICSRLVPIFQQLAKDMGILPAVSVAPASQKQSLPSLSTSQNSFLRYGIKRAAIDNVYQYLPLDSPTSLRITSATQKRLLYLSGRYQKLASRYK